MAFTVDELLLTANRRAQLEAALSNIGVTDPLGLCLDEAQAEVDRFIAGYTLSDDAVRGFVRSLALQKLYALTESVPDDIKSSYEAAMVELVAISRGERPNIPVDAETTPAAWGSEDRVDV